MVTGTGFVDVVGELSVRNRCSRAKNFLLRVVRHSAVFRDPLARRSNARRATDTARHVVMPWPRCVRANQRACGFQRIRVAQS